MGGNREYFPEIARYRPGTFVRCIPVTMGELLHAPFVNFKIFEKISIILKLYNQPKFK